MRPGRLSAHEPKGESDEATHECGVRHRRVDGRIGRTGCGGPSGTYRTTITSTALGGQLKGVWTVKFARGVITAARNGTVATQGNYSVSGSKVTFRAQPGAGRCSVVSVYRFALSGPD